LSEAEDSVRTPAEDLAFSRGVLVALSHIAAHMEDTIYDEIVQMCGPRQLVAAAQGEDFDLAHLRKRGWVTKSGRLKRRR
jgi:hypothetical protein